MKKSIRGKKTHFFIGAICLIAFGLGAIRLVNNQSNDNFTNAGGIDPITAMIVEIDRENSIMKVEPLDSSSSLNPSITLDVEITNFSNGKEESSVENFSVGYLVDVYVNTSNINDNTMYPLRIDMNGETSAITTES
ncbi:MAG: hypothetical protein R3Y29_09180 [bacterium]